MENNFRKIARDSLIFSSLFYITAIISLYLSNMPGVITHFWLANTVGIILLLRHRAASWPLPILGIAAANFLAYYVFEPDLITSSYFTIINLIEIIFTAWIVIRFSIVENFDRKINAAIILILTIELFSPALGASLGTLFFSIRNPINFWLHWYVGDGICMTIFFPIALCIIRKMWQELNIKKILEMGLWSLFTVSIAVPTLFYLPYAFILILMPLLVMALFTSVFVTIVIVCFNIFIIFTLYNAGYFIPLITPPFQQNLYVYIPTVLLFIPSYILSVFIAMLQKTKARLEDSEKQFRSIMENSSIGIALLTKDGYFFMVNDALCQIFGYSKDEFTKLNLQNITHPDDMSLTISIFEKLCNGELDIFKTDKRYLHKNGTMIWGHLSVRVQRNPDRSPQYFISHIEDITPRKNLELANAVLTNELFDEKEHLKILLTSIVDSVIATDIDGNITFMNPEAEKITGWTFDKAKGLSNDLVFFVVNKKTNIPIINPISYCLRTKKASVLFMDALLISKTGRKYDIQYSISLLQDKDQKIIGAEVIFQNITEAQDLQKELSYNASHDALTGLLNRREFELAINQALQDFNLTGVQNILCYLDLDYFKIVNDSEGHAAGDAMLQEIAALLQNRLRRIDILARLGGDEFGILLSNCSLKAGKKIATELIDLINNIRFPWKNKIFRIGVSIGMVLMTDKTASASQLLSEADVACYSAKAEGRNRIFVYQAGETESKERHREIIVASTLQEAIEENRMLLYAQKIVSTKPEKSETVHFEILLRMLNENNEVIEAKSFVLTAERFNLMANIDRWVLTQLLEKNGKLLSKVDNSIFSINLSANSLNDPNFLNFLLTLIKKSAIPAERLCFEITETAAINHMSNTITIVSELQHIGCKIALDDFGVGLSSFSYLKNFSVNFIKIDGSFIKNVATHKVDQTIVKTINQMAHNLGMETIAEYVETKTIFNTIHKIGVDYAQGYAIGKPEPLSDMIAKLP